MALPVPEAGLVIRFNYLWRREAARGAEHARYPRPCAIVVSRRVGNDGQTYVAVAPITHSDPGTSAKAMRLPPRVKEYLGLDDAPSWVIADEINEFVWPGFDLAPTETGEIAYGRLPPRLFRQLREMVLDVARAGGLGRVPR
jgi:hypothetical protein